jgi:glucose/arabinose dehydrogenase
MRRFIMRVGLAGGTAIVLAFFCFLAARAVAIDFGIERIATGLDRPVYVTQAPGDDLLLYVVEQRIGSSNQGRISTFDPTTGTRQTLTVIDNISGPQSFDDGGLHTMAFHPHFETNGLFYVSWVDNQNQNRVDEFRVENGVTTMAAEPILSYPALGNRAGRHSVDWLGFAPGATAAEANYLYITTGDGGFPEGSPAYQNVTQDLSTPYGKVLRVEVGTGVDAYPTDPSRNFGIPADNPFVAVPQAAGEVFHSGLRNPWRASFDRATGDMYIGDVGWLTREEVDFVAAGQAGLDFGWPAREGSISTPGGSSPAIGGPLGRSTNPIFEYPRTLGASIVGGYAYRGPVEAIEGHYFFADTISGNIWMSQFDRSTPAASFNGNNLSDVQEISDQLAEQLASGAIDNIVSFGEDNAGNLYLVRVGQGSPTGALSGTGELFRISRLPTLLDVEDVVLRVDPVTGELQLRNQSSQDIAFDGYAIRSPSGALLPAAWISLSDQSIGGAWSESNVSTGQLAELLASGTFVMPAHSAIDLGAAYDIESASQDLSLEILEAGTAQAQPFRVFYELLPITADFNADGTVDAGDYTVWRDMLGTTGPNLAADGNFDFVVDERDYQLWRTRFGQSIGSADVPATASIVPEPPSMATALLALVWVAAASRDCAGRKA